MRLIDADKLADKDTRGVVVDKFDVLEAPTVEAIPIELIHKLIERIKKHPNDNPSYWCTCDVIDRDFVLDEIDEMLKDWEKENGK